MFDKPFSVAYPTAERPIDVIVVALAPVLRIFACELISKDCYVTAKICYYIIYLINKKYFKIQDLMSIVKVTNNIKL